MAYLLETQRTQRNRSRTDSGWELGGLFLSSTSCAELARVVMPGHVGRLGTESGSLS